MGICMVTREVAQELGTNVGVVLGYAAREEDPLPLRYIKGKRNGGFVIASEFEDWIRRNTCLYNEREQHR